MTTIRGSRKNIVKGGGAGPKMPTLLTTYGERDPPHGENGPHVERKHCPHRKNDPTGKSPPWNFLSMLLPPGRTPTFAPHVTTPPHVSQYSSHVP